MKLSEKQFDKRPSLIYLTLKAQPFLEIRAIPAAKIDTEAGWRVLHLCNAFKGLGLTYCFGEVPSVAL